jgi:hypothetical protein
LGARLESGRILSQDQWLAIFGAELDSPYLRAISTGIRMEARMAKMVKKADLPRKSCAHCGFPIVWRKKWARDWEAVRFCSDRCRSDAKRAARG